MSGAVPWTPKEYRAAIAAIKKASTIDEAVYLAQEAVPGRKITEQALESRVKREEGKPMGHFLKAARHEAKKPAERVAEDLIEARMKADLAGSEEERHELRKQLATALKQLEMFQLIKATKPPRPIVAPKRVGAKQRRGFPFMACSDWHVEERVDPKKVNGLNEYDLDIADRRITQLADAYEWLMRDVRFDCREGGVWLGGDHFSGWIHEELKEAGNLSPVQAVKWLAPRIVTMLRKILATCQTIETLHVWCNDGNHGRLTNKIRVQTRTENSIEWLMFHQIAAMMADEPRIRFSIADGEYLYADIFGKTIVMFHGDSVRSNGGIGGIMVPLQRKLSRLRSYKKIDLAVLGHFHQMKNEPQIIVNGSMIGTTPYSMRETFEPEPVAQAWTMFDSQNFRSISAPIWLK